MRVGILGLGAVGRRLARELTDDPSVSSVALLSGVPRDQRRVRDSFGPKVQMHVEPPRIEDAEVEAVVLCTPDENQLDQAREALGAGCHVVALADSVATVSGLLGLEDYAREVGRSVVVGAGASPGLSALVACHAAALFDEVAEVAVAVTGAGGPACADRRSRAAKSDTQEWRDGEWVDCAAKSGAELVWFPDPLGAVDCARGDLSDVLLLRRVLPDAVVVSAKLGRAPTRPVRMRLLGRGPHYEQGGVRVAVSGRLDGAPATVVYASVAPAVASSAVVAAQLATALISADRTLPPVGGAAEFLDARTALVRAAERGVPTLVFEGPG